MRTARDAARRILDRALDDLVLAGDPAAAIVAALIDSSPRPSSVIAGLADRIGNLPDALQPVARAAIADDLADYRARAAVAERDEQERADRLSRATAAITDIVGLPIDESATILRADRAHGAHLSDALHPALERQIRGRIEIADRLARGTQVRQVVARQLGVEPTISAIHTALLGVRSRAVASEAVCKGDVIAACDRLLLYAMGETADRSLLNWSLQLIARGSATPPPTPIRKPRRTSGAATIP
jgi:hypothetical protein